MDRWIRAGLISSYVLGSLAATPAAYAATAVSLSSGTVIVTAAPGEVNNVEVNIDEQIIDTAGVVAGAGCYQISPTMADCGYDREWGTQYDNWSNIVVSLGDRDDTYESSMVQLQRATIDAGSGNDILQSVDANLGAQITGDEGNARIYGTSGDDSINVGPGDDTLEGHKGNDTLEPGEGRDVVIGDSAADPLAMGSDRIYARDGEVDQVSCQEGADTVEADHEDIIETDMCESVFLPYKPPVVEEESGAGERRQAAIAKCKKMKKKTKQQRRKRARCLEKARAIGS